MFPGVSAASDKPLTHPRRPHGWWCSGPQHGGCARGRGLDARVRPGRARAGAGGCVRTGPGRARMSARVPEHTLSNPFIPNACARVRALRGVSRPERTRTRAPSGLVSALAVRTAPGAIPCGRRAKAPHPGLFWTSAPVQTARERDQVGRCSDAHASDARPHATARTAPGRVLSGPRTDGPRPGAVWTPRLSRRRSDGARPGAV